MVSFSSPVGKGLMAFYQDYLQNFNSLFFYICGIPFPLKGIFQFGSGFNNSLQVLILIKTALRITKSMRIKHLLSDLLHHLFP